MTLKRLLARQTSAWLLWSLSALALATLNFLGHRFYVYTAQT